MDFRLVFLVMSLVGATAVLAWRMHETTRPLSVKRIVMPPLGMSTGLSMFLYPPMRIPLLWALVAFTSGAALFSFPLIATSELFIEQGEIYLRRSRAFLWVLLGLVAVRFALRSYVDHLVSPTQTASIFFLLAFGMIVRWREWMLRRFRGLQAEA